MTKIWKLLKGGLDENILKTKKIDRASTEGYDNEQNDRRRDDGSTNYDDSPSRSHSSHSCYVSYDDESYDDYYYSGAARVVTAASYDGAASDFYIGVDASTASTIYLPTAVADGKIIIIKAEMKPPIGKRLITVTTLDGSSIDGYKDLLIQVSHEYRTLLYRGGHWHVIGK